MKVDYKRVIEIVRETRSLSFPSFGNVTIKEYKDGSTFDAVTQIDHDIEEFLKKELYKLEPEIGFVGEEFGGDRENKSFWLIDPIDGTAHFIRGIPYCTTMLALIDNGQVIFSIIYDFVNDIIYHAELGVGAYKNGEKIKVSDRDVNESFVSCEINLKKGNNQSIYNLIRSKTKILHHLCAGYEFILVATGKMEGRIMYDPFGKDYDFAPGSLLVSEAGGVVKNFKSDTYDYKNLNFIASNKSLYNSLIKSEDNIEKLMD